MFVKSWVGSELLCFCFVFVKSESLTRHRSRGVSQAASFTQWGSGKRSGLQTQLKRVRLIGDI